MKWTMIHVAMFEQDSNLPPLGYEVLDDVSATVFHNQTYYPQAPTPEQAAHIVHCVNNHDALLAALEAMVQAMVDYQMDVDDPPPYRHCQMMDAARAAIARAKGEA